MLLSTTRLKPRRAASALTSIGVAGAGNRARAERQRVGFGRGRRQPLVIASQRRRVAQEKVRDEHGHRAAHVRVRRHQGVAGRSA